MLVNKKGLGDYFRNEQDRIIVEGPLSATGKQSEVDIVIRVHGGGTTGQAGACRMGSTRKTWLPLKPLPSSALMTTRW